MSEQSTNPPQGKHKLEASHINTGLLAVIIALSAWTLNRVSDLSISMAVSSTFDQTQQREIDAMRLRMAAIETKQQELAVDIVKLNLNKP